MDTKKSLQKYLEELSSNSPTPGGGNVADLCGALSASLGTMVCNLTIGKKKYLDVETEMNEMKVKLNVYVDKFISLAKYDNEGNFVNVKTNLPVDKLPEKIRSVAQSFGEIMNAIVISNNIETFYEIILRDKELTRYELLVDMDGKVLSNQKL